MVCNGLYNILQSSCISCSCKHSVLSHLKLVTSARASTQAVERTAVEGNTVALATVQGGVVGPLIHAVVELGSHEEGLKEAVWAAGSAGW